MKMKITISISIIFILLISMAGYFFYQYKVEQNRVLRENEKDKQIAEINKKLENFNNNKIIENTSDAIVNYFNSILIVNQEINQLDYEQFYATNITLETIKPSNVPKTLATIKNQKYSFSFDEEKLKSLLPKEEYLRKEYLDIYYNHSVIKNKEKLIAIVNTYNQKLEKLEKFLQFLNTHTEDYKIENNSIIYLKNEFKGQYESCIKDTNISFSIKSESFFGKKIPILMYHGVLDNPWGDAGLFVRVKEFEQQMNYLKENGYTPIFVSEIKEANNYEKPIIITFDDGYVDVYLNAYPILQKNNFKSDIYLISNWLNGDVYMTVDMVKEMSLSPLIEIGSHTLTHVQLATKSYEEQERQIRNSKEDLEKLIDKKITSIAYPTGSYNSNTLNITRKYYEYGLTTNSGFEYSKNNHNYTLKRIKIDRGISISQFANLIR